MSKETGLLVGVVATGVGFLFGNIWLMIAGSIIIVVESRSE
jgi:hypothetical protein